MRHSLIAFAAAAIVAGVSFGASPAKTAPLPALDSVGSQNTAAEKVYYRRWGYRPYGYWRPYRYYAPPRYYYGPPYARYYRPYGYGGYGRRPYYGYRHWW